MDTASIRRDFPILKREIGGHPLTYLDNAATTQKPRAVIDALVDFYEHHNANVHRGVHTLSEEATALYEGARAKAAGFLGASDPGSIIFTRGTTESINLVAQGWARHNLRSGDEILLSEMEHHSNIIPWQIAARETGAVLRYIPVTDEGLLDMDEAGRMITEKTALLALTHTSNVLGTINPVADLIRLARSRGALVLLDAAQGVPRQPLDVTALDCDFLACSGHKMLAPTGIGVLYGKPELLERMEPPSGGGGMIRQVWREGADWREPPWRFEPGTPDISGAVGLGAALDYLSALGLQRVQAHEAALTGQALRGLEAIPGVTVYGPSGGVARGGVVSFNVDGVHPHDVAQVLDEVGVAVRAGHHCCQLLMKRLGVAATVRLSFAPYNDAADVERLLQGIGRVKEVFGDDGEQKRALP
ncbi:MAG: cysteine desulfurase [SAR324 cluster bacterium]|nr:cysteine desulfurase [SAR324 cluster bacterium]